MIRLGVIGTGRIAARFMNDQELVPEIYVTCIYNPHMKSAKLFAERFQVKKFTDDWSDLVSCVDAVYIASPHQTHMEYVKSALKSRKHVLCEKPMAFSKKSIEELYNFAEQNGVVLMEAIKTAYCPGFKHLMQTASSGVIGTICDVEACFTKLEDPLGRELSDSSYGGSVIELGTYVLLPIIKIFGDNATDIQFLSIKNAKGIDIFTKINLIYEQRFGLGKVGLGVKSEGNLIISGTSGYIYAKSPWWLTREYEIRYEDPNKRELYTFEFERNGLLYEVQAFVDEIRSHKRKHNENKVISTAIAGIMEKYFEQKDRAEHL